MGNTCQVTRIHLKTGNDTIDRKKLIDFCLNRKETQYVAIGWSCVYETETVAIKSFEQFYCAVKQWNQKESEKEKKPRRMNSAINKFSYTQKDDLFWTRDLSGNYWICRAKGKAEAYCDAQLDIGAVVPVEAYLYGLEVAGQIRASFTRARGGIAESFSDSMVIMYSQYVFNKLSGREHYAIKKISHGNILDNLPPFDLEELVISYIQLVEGYYLLSNSIARKSTSINIECEFRSREKDHPKAAVVQVKGGKDSVIDAAEYAVYEERGYIVYFFAPKIENIDKLSKAIWISREKLMDFYRESKAILPDSITRWESIID